MDLQDGRTITPPWLVTIAFGLLIFFTLTKIRNKKKLAGAQHAYHNVLLSATARRAPSQYFLRYY